MDVGGLRLNEIKYDHKEQQRVKTKYEQVSRGAATLLKMNKKKTTTIENEQRGERRATIVSGDFDKMKEKRNGNNY